MRKTKITITRISQPKNKNVNDELLWFCDSLGITGKRDKDRSCFRMFITLLKTVEDGLSSDEISERVGLSRGTVVHHLNKLMNSGLVIHRHNRYILRVDNLSSLVDEIERDIYSTLDKLKQVAGDIDHRLDL